MSQQSEALDPSAPPRVWPGDHVVDLDLRSLAVLRVLMGLILLLDTVVRSTDIVAFYSDFGSLSRTALLELGWNQQWFSLYMGTGIKSGVAALMLLQGVCAVGLILGWRTRVMTFFSWLFLISIHSRNPMVLNGGDIYLRVVLFWMLFLPCGQLWSWDAKKGRSDVRWWTPAPWKGGLSVRSLAGLGLLMQISAVYWFAALPKTDPSWTADYTATNLALMLDCVVTPFGLWFRETFWEWLPWMTYLVIGWEFLAPFLLFFPCDRGQVRTAAICGIGAMHFGFGLCMELGFFAWIGICMPLSLLPAWFWERPGAPLARWLDRLFATSQPNSPPGDWRGWPLREAVCGFMILFVFAWNCTNEGLRYSPSIPTSLRGLAQVFRIDQRWNMFSPGPLREDGWFVIEGVCRDGTPLNMLDGSDKIVWEKPEWISRTYKNERWRKYMMNLWSAENSRYRLPFGQYLTRKFNSQRKGRKVVVEFKIYFMKELTNLDGTEAEPEKVMIWQHWCFDRPKDAEANAEPAQRKLSPESKSSRIP